jgi:hypothetical protein
VAREFEIVFMPNRETAKKVDEIVDSKIKKKIKPSLPDSGVKLTRTGERARDPKNIVELIANCCLLNFQGFSGLTITGHQS